MTLDAQGRSMPLADEERPLMLEQRRSRAPGMGFGHELLVALIMAVAMGATLLLYR